MASIAQRAALSSCLLALLGGVTAGTAANAADLRIGLRADPDVLDPAQGTSVAGRMVFAALCDKLIDTTKDGGFRPQLATAWDWSDAGKTLTLTLRDGVTFQDGESMDAEAVKFNLERYRSDPISKRKSELKPVDSVEVVDPATVRLHLSEAYAPLIGVLADRAGMMMSPKAVKAAGEKIGDHPVCAGPFAFVSRVAQDSIKLERFADYWDKDAISIDHLSYLPIPDDTVRLVNLRSGDLDMIERLSAPDIPAVKGDANLTFVEGPSIAYDLLSINVANGAQADNPLGTSAKVRQAFELSLDREALNQVVYEDLFKPSNQHEMPGSTYWDDAHPVPARDVEKAKALLAEAGTPSPSFTLTVANSPVSQQVGQLIQAMAGEAGFDVKLQTVESATLAADSSKGNYQATMAIWSGRPDPDANVSPWAACDGFLNWGHYCNKDLDALLSKARQSTDEKERKSLYDQAVDIYLTDLPHIVLYHYTSLYALRSTVTGFTPFPDGLVRLQGVTVGGAN